MILWGIALFMVYLLLDNQQMHVFDHYLCLQDGSTLLLGSERLFQHLDMLFAV